VQVCQQRGLLNHPIWKVCSIFFECRKFSAIAEPAERAKRIWSEILARDGLVLFFSESEARIAATCMLITAPNLLRGGRGHGVGAM
jgi:hypothetical protein